MKSPNFAKACVGYRGGDPGDFWHIDAVYLDPRWVRRQDPVADFAIGLFFHLVDLILQAGNGFIALLECGLERSDCEITK